MATNPTLLKSARLFHLYSGVFFAPALIFFAFTGAVQTFSKHETTKGSNYKPPAILVKLAQLHKKQTLVVPVRKTPPPEAQSGQKPGPEAKPVGFEGLGTNPKPHSATPDASGPGAPGTELKGPPPSVPPAPTQKAKNLLPMKIFFALSAWGLFLSSLSGIYMAYKFTRRRVNITLILFAGVAIPLLLLLF